MKGMSKVPKTCAVCGHSAKVSVHFKPVKHIGWYCAHDPYGDRVKESRILCARGKLPVPPKWCPRRKA